MSSRLFWCVPVGGESAGDTTESVADAGDDAEGGATSDVTMTYWSMWNSTEPQAIAIQEAIDAYTAETGIQVTVQWNGRDTQQQTIQAALDSKTSIDLFDEDFQRVSTQYNKSCLSLEDMAAAVGYEDYAVAALPAAVRNWAGELIAIPSYSEHPQEAFDLIVKITSGEYDAKMAMASNGIPADIRNEEWPEMLAGVREAFNVQTGVYDWNCGMNANADLGTAFQDPAAKLFEGSLDGQGFVEAMDALY